MAKSVMVADLRSCSTHSADCARALSMRAHSMQAHDMSARTPLLARVTSSTITMAHQTWFRAFCH